jgi:hypothetical protein
MIKGIQVLGLLVSAYLIIHTILQGRRGQGFKKTGLWLGLWVSVGILFAFPSLTTLALPVLAMENTVLMVVVVGLVIAYALAYESYQQATRTERKLTELVQNIGLRNYMKKARGNPGDDDEEQ